MYRSLRIYTIFMLFCHPLTKAQAGERRIDSFRIPYDIKITIDYPETLKAKKETIIVFYALPNGNTTAQTMGKKLLPGDDWHYDIQHIAAQTAFIRNEVPGKNIIVLYLENDLKSWPTWKQKHPDFGTIIPGLVDSLYSALPGRKKKVCLNGHSGGGSFILGYLKGVSKIPSFIHRISFLDSNYGYDSTYYNKFAEWLQSSNHNRLNVFAYNDSIALYNGKPVVSATGGTWYRSKLMLTHLEKEIPFTHIETDSFFIHKSQNKQVEIYLKKNINRGIYHTQQVELNGFIHSIFCGTKHALRRYEYYSQRAYNQFVR